MESIIIKRRSNEKFNVFVDGEPYSSRKTFEEAFSDVADYGIASGMLQIAADDPEGECKDAAGTEQYIELLEFLLAKVMKQNKDLKYENDLRKDMSKIVMAVLLKQKNGGLDV